MTWQAANCASYRNPKRTVYFLVRRTNDGTTEYYNLPSGRMKQFRSMEAAKAFAEKLNTKEADS